MSGPNGGRSVSQPISAIATGGNGRDLTGGASSGSGSGFNDKLSSVVRSISGSSPAYKSSFTPAPPTMFSRDRDSSSSTSTANSHRLSNPPLHPPPSSPLPGAPGSVAPSSTSSPDFSPARRGSFNQNTGTARELTMAKRASGDSALRVVNITPDPARHGDDQGWTGRAL